LSQGIKKLGPNTFLGVDLGITSGGKLLMRKGFEQEEIKVCKNMSKKTCV